MAQLEESSRSVYAPIAHLTDKVTECGEIETNVLKCSSVLSNGPSTMISSTVLLLLGLQGLLGLLLGIRWKFVFTIDRGCTWLCDGALVRYLQYST
jgi:hypothetical protein